MQSSLSQFIFTYPFAILLFSFLIGGMCMPMVLKIARAKHFVVKPNKRMSHTGEVPNIGGIDIFVSFVLTYLLFEYDHMQYAQYIFIGIFLILMVGFVDDLIDLAPHWKLSGELLAGFFLIVASGVRITHLHGFMGINEISDAASYCLSFFIYIGIINALNLIDGVDGLASGLGIVYCLFFALYFQLIGEIHLSVLAYCLIGSLLVFFLYNVFGRSRRKIFMGDSGSLLLGYMITLFVFRFCEMNAYHYGPEKYHMAAAPAVAICVLAVPLFDTLRVMCTRIKKGVSPFSADKNHIHHLLLRIGLSHIQVSMVLIFLTILFSLLGIALRNISIGYLICIVFAICCILVYILWRIVDRKSKSE